MQCAQSQPLRTYFSRQLRGHGLEIRPLDNPLARHSQMRVDYLDPYSPSTRQANSKGNGRRLLVEPHLIGDPEELSDIADESYDFVAAACVLEELQNPLYALKSWFRVLKGGGRMYLAFSGEGSKAGTLVPATSFEHCLLDFLEPSQERDYEHYLVYAVKALRAQTMDALSEAERLSSQGAPILRHRFDMRSAAALLDWTSRNFARFAILEGPLESGQKEEFHFLLEKDDQRAP